MVAKSPQGIKSAQELEDYWTKNPEGLAKWATTDQPWTNLNHHLLKWLNPDLATKTASRWFIKVFGFARIRPRREEDDVSEDILLNVTGPVLGEIRGRHVTGTGMVAADVASLILSAASSTLTDGCEPPRDRSHHGV